MDLGASLPYWLKRSSAKKSGLALHLAEKGGLATTASSFQPSVLRALQGVLLPQIKVAVVDAVQDHVHPRQVVGGAVHLLAVIVVDMLDLPRDAQQQRAGAAGRVIDGFEARLARGHNPRQDGGDLLRRVELARLLARAAGKLADEVFVGIAQDVALGIVQPEVDGVQVDQNFGDEVVFVFFGAAQFGGGEVEVFEQLVEIIFAGGAHGGAFDVVEDLGQVVEDEFGWGFLAARAARLWKSSAGRRK